MPDSLDYIRASLIVAILLAGIGRLVGRAPASWSLFPVLSAWLFLSYYVLSAWHENQTILRAVLVVVLPPLLVGALLFFSPMVSWKPLRSFLLLLIILAPSMAPDSILAWRAPVGYSYMLFRLYDGLECLRERDAGIWRSLLLQVTAFPALPAGPVIMNGQFSVDARPFSLRGVHYRRGVWLVILGILKLMVVLPLVDQHLETGIIRPVQLSLYAVRNIFATGLFHYAHLFVEFSAYSDVVVGLAAVMGLRIRHNFLRPFAAVTLRDFWRRWHRTLSSFAVRHLYIPMGGSRVGAMQHSANLLLVFLFIGLWHGLSVHFALWGAMHALYLIAEKRLLEPVFSGLPSAFRPLQGVLTQTFVTLSWVVFFWR